ELEEHPFGVLAEHKGCLGTMGYVAVKNLSEDGTVGHIGTLITNPYHRNENIASQCLDFLLAKCGLYLPNMKEAFAHVNEKSLPLFIAKGGIDIEERKLPYSTNCNLVINMTPALNNQKGL
ncbi:MAG: GNAT family N-acetyltransferase, partial [Patescibacteria group bacterium]